MARFYFEQFEMVVSENHYKYYDDGEIIDEEETEDVLYLWAIYDGREGHMEPIGYMKTATQAQMVCDGLNK